MTVLLTPRLRLRPGRIDDVEALHAIFADPQAMRYWSSLPHASLDVTRAWLADMMAIPRERGEDFLIEQDGRVIGKVGLYRFPDIGYILAPDCWGRGLAHEALTAVLAHVFSARGLSQVRADVDPRNTGSLKLLERLGFRESGRANRTWLIGEEWCDSIYLTLNAADWAGLG